MLAAAQTDAQARGLAAPTALHILAVILRQKGDSAAVLLRRAGIDIDALKTAIVELAPSAASKDADAREWADVLEAALGEAQRLGHETAGTAHLLLGIMRHGRSDAAGLLKRAGVDVLQFRQVVLSSIGDAQGGQRHPTVFQRPNLFAVAAEWNAEVENGHTFVDRPDLAGKIVTALRRAVSPHVAIVGAKGVGKRALLGHVFHELARDGGAAPSMHALRLEIFKLIGWRWQRAQQKIFDFLREVRTPGPFLLVIDDLDVFAQSPAWDDAVLLLRLIMEKSVFPIVLVCDASTYELHVQRDPYLMSRLTPINVPAPQGDEALRILRVHRERLESFHRVRVVDEAVEQAFIAASEVSEQEAFSLACSILDHAAAKVRTRGRGGSDLLSAAMVEEKLAEIARLKQEAVNAQDFHRAAQLRDQESELKQEKLSLAIRDEPVAPPVVDAAAIIELVTPMSRKEVRTSWE